MKYIPTILLLLVFVAAFRFATRMSKARPGDFQAIQELADARALRIISIEQRHNQWPYWLRGHLLSNISRIFVVAVESKQGASRELHLTIDNNNWGAPRGVQVLRDIAISP